jgi:predicted dehydrogenase
MVPVSMLVIGLANPHVPGYLRGFAHNNRYVKLLALSDFDSARLESARKILGDKLPEESYYTDWKAMLDEKPEAEAVLIGADNIHHCEIMREVIKRGKHIYSMKVLSMDEGECREIIDGCRKKSLLLQVELELHFNPQYAHLRSVVQNDGLGELESIYITNVSQCPGCYFSNWIDPVLSYNRRVPLRQGSEVCRGGALTDHPHPFYLMYWITGSEIKRIFAMSGRNQRDWMIVEDHIAITGQLEGVLN